MDPYEFNDMMKKLREGERVMCPLCKLTNITHSSEWVVFCCPF